MQRVLVVDRNREPLMPCHPARARELLRKGRARVLRRCPFTIMIVDREGGAVQPLTLKIDPGSKTTGLALVANCQRGRRVVWAADLHHRGQQIRDALLSRRQQRRGRRGRKTRYRPARFDNRRRPEGWLPPSLQSRVDNIQTWTNWLWRWAPVSAVSLELVRFDTQLTQNPETSGVEYQQGTLQGYEVKEYLLEKWEWQCAYCGVKGVGVESVPLEVEHIIPKARGGSNRVSNLAMACGDCNRAKGNQTAAEFGYSEVQEQARQPLKDAAAINSTRWAVYNLFRSWDIPLKIGTGGRTKYNRTRQGYPKTHWIDAACVGVNGEAVHINPGHVPLDIKATGRQSRRMCLPDRYGFPRTRAKQGRVHFGFQTGDIVRAVVSKGKKAGTHVGRVAVRSRGSFDITTRNGRVTDISHRLCALLHRADGYSYQKGEAAFPPLLLTYER